MASQATYLAPIAENPEGYRPELLTPDAYPALRTISAAHMMDAVIRPNRGPMLPLYVYVPCMPTHGEWISEEIQTL